jgi:hypothetical protein
MVTRLPAYRVNPMLDLSPISNALTGYQQQMNTNDQLGMQDRQLVMREKEFDDNQRQRATDRMGRMADLYLNETDPNRRRAIGQSFTKLHPQLGTRLTEAGMDPNDHDTVARFLKAETSSSDPLGEKQKLAQIEATRASTAASNAQASQISRQTPEWRMANAAKYGIDPNTPEGKAFVISGQYSPTQKFGSFKEGEQPYQVVNGKIEWITTPNADGPGGNKKFAEEAAKASAQGYSENVKDARNAMVQSGDLQRLKELSAVIGTQGKTAEIAKALGPYATAVGVKIDNLSDIEAFTSVISKVAPTLRVPGSGAQSDFELKGFMQSLPALAQTAQGRALIVDQLDAMNNYKMAVGDISNRALLGEIDRRTAEAEIKALGNPLTLWRQTNPNALPPGTPAQPTGQAPAARLGSQVMEQMRPMVDAVRGELQSGRYDAATASARIKQALPPDVAAQVMRQLGIADPAPTSRGTLKNRGTLPNE